MNNDKRKPHFEWDELKNFMNKTKHGVSFAQAQLVFLDDNRVIAEDLEHSLQEKRYYCFGNIGGEIMTVRFTYRKNRIRIIGAGYWRKGRRIYENAQEKIYR